MAAPMGNCNACGMDGRGGKGGKGGGSQAPRTKGGLLKRVGSKPAGYYKKLQQSFKEAGKKKSAETKALQAPTKSNHIVKGDNNRTKGGLLKRVGTKPEGYYKKLQEGFKASGAKKTSNVKGWNDGGKPFWG